MARFGDRVAIVTGAAGGIGRAIAVGLAAEGATVVVNDVREEQLAQIVSDTVLPVVGDTAAPATAERLVAAAVDGHGRVDLLVNNAAVFTAGEAEDYPLDAWRRTLDVNLSAYFYLARAAGREMIAQRGGVVLNVASMAGLGGTPGNVAYCASKHGVVGLTRALAAEWARYGIRVNALCPGLTETELVQGFAEQAPERYEQRKANILVGRAATAEEQAAVALFLLSDEAGYVSGLMAAVDGGNQALYSGYDVPRATQEAAT